MHSDIGFTTWMFKTNISQSLLDNTFICKLYRFVQKEFLAYSKRLPSLSYHISKYFTYLVFSVEIRIREISNNRGDRYEESKGWTHYSRKPSPKKCLKKCVKTRRKQQCLNHASFISLFQQKKIILRRIQIETNRIILVYSLNYWVKVNWKYKILHCHHPFEAPEDWQSWL